MKNEIGSTKEKKEKKWTEQKKEEGRRCKEWFQKNGKPEETGKNEELQGENLETKRRHRGKIEIEEKRKIN